MSRGNPSGRGKSRNQNLAYAVRVSTSSNFVKNSIEHTFLGNNEIKEMMQMADKKSDNLDNKKAKIKEFKINFIFDDKGESFENLTERAFGNYCSRRLEDIS